MSKLRGTFIKPDKDVRTVAGSEGIVFATEDDKRAFNQHRALDMMESFGKHEFDRKCMIDVLEGLGYTVTPPVGGLR